MGLKMKILSQVVFLLTINLSLFAVHKEELNGLFSPHPFNYDLGVKVLPASEPNANVMICCHGMCSDNRIGDVMRTYPSIKDNHLVSFNFPDHGMSDDAYNPNKTTFGTIEELLPILYILKKIVVDAHIEAVNLYGFSAGGGAVINVVAALNSNIDLRRVGISPEDKLQILSAIQKGRIILDCPLKSIEEIMAFRGSSYNMKVLAQRYQHNEMRPIDAVQKLSNLNIVLHFQSPDEVLSNRDDALFVQRLREANAQGTTLVIVGNEGGHNAYHASLWQAL